MDVFRFCRRESVKSGHHCCPCQAPPPPVLVTTSPNARIIRQSSQPEASACCCSGCCCPLHTGATPSAASLRQLREPGDGIAGIAADSLRINGGIRQFRQVSTAARLPHRPSALMPPSSSLSLSLSLHSLARPMRRKNRITCRDAPPRGPTTRAPRVESTTVGFSFSFSLSSPRKIARDGSRTVGD